jgi:hypothetical protein
LKQHKLWFDEEYSKLLHERKQAKLQWLQNPNQTNGDNLNNVRGEDSRTFRTQKRDYHHHHHHHHHHHIFQVLGLLACSGSEFIFYLLDSW